MSETPLPQPRSERSDPEFYSAAIYGSIIVTALIGALWGDHISARTMTVQLIATMTVFFLAHTWAAVAGERLHTGHRLSTSRVLALARAQWPMIEAGFAPIFALTLAWVGLIEYRTGAKLAIAIGVVQLFAWGFVLGQRVYGRRLGALLSAAGNGLLGLTLVALEIAVLH